MLNNKVCNAININYFPEIDRWPHEQSLSIAAVISDPKEPVKIGGHSQQEFLREKESSRKWSTQYIELAIIDKEIVEIKDSLADNIKINKIFHAQFPRLLDEAWKKKNFELFQCIEKKIPRKSG